MKELQHRSTDGKMSGGSRQEKNKRSFRADSLSLLLSALRSRLFIVAFFVVVCLGLNSGIFGGDFDGGLDGIFGGGLNRILGGILGQNASAASLTLSVPTSPLTLDITPSSEATFTKSDASTVKVKTDGFYGYSFSIAVKDGGSNDLVSGGNKLKSIAAEMTEADYQSSGETNTWGFQPSMMNGAENTTNFYPGPVAATKLDETTTKNDAEKGYTVRLGAKVDQTLATGNYTNNFVLTAVANSVHYSITYQLNGGADGPATNPQTGDTTEEKVKLDATTPTRSGYEFLGWCSTETSDENCAGTVYQPGDDFSIGGTKGVVLYAMWEKMPLLTELLTVDSSATQITFKTGAGIDMIIVADENGMCSDCWSPSYGDATTNVVLPSAGGKKIVVTVVPKSGYVLSSWTKTSGASQTWTANGKTGTYKAMKDVTEAECLASGEAGMNATDERNGLSYTVGKFDQRCWMLSNLRLGPGTTLNPTTSDVSANFTLPSEADSNAWTSINQNYYGKKNMKACKGLLGYNSTNKENSCADQTSIVTEYYYNWYAAIANPYVSSNLTGFSDLTEAVDNKSLGSICPKNWKLVPNSADLSIKSLEVATWSANKAANPGRLTSSGNLYDGTQHYVGHSGLWWSSGRDDNEFAFRSLHIGGGKAGSDHSRKLLGLPVRCIR